MARLVRAVRGSFEELTDDTKFNWDNLQRRIHAPGKPILVVSEDGEVCEWNSGVSYGFIDLPYAPRNKETYELDGVSIGGLGTTTKHMILGAEDRRLLREISSNSAKEREKLLTDLGYINKSSFMKTIRADPLSVYNSYRYRLTHRLACKRTWSNPRLLKERSERTAQQWIARKEKFGPSGFSDEALQHFKIYKPAPEIWKTRKLRYGKYGMSKESRIKWSRGLSRGQLRRWAWLKLPFAIVWLFG